jgi:hypothetical protein
MCSRGKRRLDIVGVAGSIGVAALRRAEKENSVVKMTAANAERVVSVLKVAGVEFLVENGA